MTDYPPSYPPPDGGGYPPPPPSSGGYAPPPPGAPGYPPVNASPGTNGMAIASLVCSLVGWVCAIGPVLGIIFGFIGLNQIKKSGQGGRGLALAGIIVGIVAIVLGILWAIFVVIIGVAEQNNQDKQNQSNDHGWGAPATVLVIDYQAVSSSVAA